MDPVKVQNTLRQIGKIYNRILAPDAQRILAEAAANVNSSREAFENGTAPNWGYVIDHKQPLRFKPSKIMKGIEPEIDVYCDVKWQNADWPVKQDVKVRIWSQNTAIAYREDLDSEAILEKVTNGEHLKKHPGRVISRFHFDRVNHDQGRSIQYHPDFHVQVGGKPEDYELCWHPKSFDIPRIGFQPMELFLTCQLIAVNFFRKEYRQLSKGPEWTVFLNLYQETLLYPYYSECVRHLNEKRSLLDALESSRP